MKSTFLIAILSIFTIALVFAGCNQTTAEKSNVATNTETSETAKAGEIKRTELTENAGYVMELNAAPQKVNANQDVSLSFSVKDKDGKLFDKLKVVHEKLIHLLVVSDDLAFFDHVHPEKLTDSGFKLDYKFPAGGVYKLYADFTPENSPQIVNVFDVPVGGEKRSKTPLVADKEFTKTVDGLTFTMKAGEDLKAAKGLTLNFFVKDANGETVTDLESYLGAMAHFVIISEDTTKFLHAHAMEGKMTETKGTGGHSDHNDKHGDMEMDMKTDTDNAETPAVMAHTEFPIAGLYKLWGQFQRGGKVITVPFVLNIAPADASKTANNVEIPKDAYKITVSKAGFTPGEITLDKSKFSKLAFLRTDSENCGNEIVFKDLNIKKQLPVGEVVLVDLPENFKGKTLNFACGMDMLKGKILVQ
ncbi:hypothetical protein BH20ACI1_BH20ACI1_30220 [soil metagenome]